MIVVFIYLDNSQWWSIQSPEMISIAIGGAGLWAVDIKNQVSKINLKKNKMKTYSVLRFISVKGLGIRKDLKGGTGS